MQGLLSNKVDVGAIKQMGAKAAQMKALGLSAARMKAIGYTTSELKSVYSARELEAAGHTLEELKSAFSAMELGNEGYELKSLGYDVDDLGALKKVGIQAPALKAAGFDATALIDAGFDLFSVASAGFDLKMEGYSLHDLMRMPACDAHALLKAGFDANDFKAAGFDPNSMADEMQRQLQCSGIMQDLPADFLNRAGWARHHVSPYLTAIQGGDIDSIPRDATYVFVGCRRTTDGVITLGAIGERNQVLKEMELDKTHEHNGVHWYFCRHSQFGSFGFAPSSKINLMGGDKHDQNDPLRLSWPLTGHINFPRAGAVVNYDIKATVAGYEKLLFYTSATKHSQTNVST